MAQFECERVVQAPAEQVWDALTDWSAHARWVPLTSIRVGPEPAGVGATFVGRSGVGPLAFDDPMRVTEWAPPTATGAGRCAIIKTGRVIKGSAWFTVTPLPDSSSCSVFWSETILLGPLAKVPGFSWVASQIGARVFSGVIAKMAHEVRGQSEAS